MSAPESWSDTTRHQLPDGRELIETVTVTPLEFPEAPDTVAELLGLIKGDKTDVD
ncbi:hypothetical protein [Amycolatopsis sp. 195334CR]|uniref:hypothetical protein n=1 Tax=Amycolatopsis sp. 195334CR TaxID=2814588 RepID=UPI001A8C98BC|nr:hypothetical protein [Amycolatopsis sp. 195334CR]MBN6037455.1 hypothetical protein [Amycolatopsis sp. 195334CR]